MLDTILMFVFVLFAVLGFFVSAVLLLLKISAPKGEESFFLVAFPSGSVSEYLLEIRWLQAVLTVTGLKERITLVAVEERREDGEVSELETAFSDRKDVIILKNG